MKSHRTRSAGFVAAVALGAAALVGSATAQVNEDGVRKAFAQADVNKDGYVNVDEYVAAVVLIFRQADRNGDRMISMEEAAAFSPTHTPEAFRKADRNGDGKLSLGEVVSVKIVDFFDMDTDGDGVIAVEELLIHERRLASAKPAAK